MSLRPSVLQHFRAEEHPFIERVEDWIEQVMRRHQPYLSDFLNPRERYISSILIKRNPDLACTFDGGYEEAEYTRCLLMPDYWQPSPQEMELCFLEVSGASKFQSLTHRDYLGALLNLGIERNQIGDLLVNGDRCQLVATYEIGTYIRLNLQRVHRVNVTVEEIERAQLTVPEKIVKQQSIIVASPRLDAVLSAAFLISRNKVVPLIRSGKCKLNWKTEDDPATPVEPGDTLSLRGYGRAYVFTEEGQTRRGRTRLTVGRLR